MANESDHIQRLNAALGQRYRIERELGAGGSATVYLATDLKHERQVALKVLRPQLTAAIGLERFLREIKTTANLQHPHILALYDSGEVEGVLFYVMPYIPGETLRDRLNRDKRLSPSDALHIVRQVADALAYAHARDLVHRDIKPENILLNGKQAFVSDFGIARAVTSARETRVTQTGAIIGTPLYMSPEQASEDPELDGRSDLYSLACVLFEMLAGEPPFTGPTVEAVLVQRFTQPPPRLSDRVHGASPEIDAALYRAMARDPGDRFSSVSAFVEACASSTQVSAAVAKSVAVLPFVNIGSDAEDEFFADGVTEELINALAHFEGLRVAARTSSFAFKGKSQDLRLVGEKLNVGAVLEGSLRRAGSRLRITAQLVEVSSGYQLWSERFDRELTDVFAVQEEIASSIASTLQVLLTDKGDERPVRPPTANMDAYELFLKGRALQYRRGPALTEALACFERAIALDGEFAEAFAWMADSYRLLGLYGSKAPHGRMPKAKAAAQRALALNPDLAEAHATLADVYLVYDHDLSKAEASWGKALAVDPEHIRARCEHALWWLATVRGDNEQAIRETRHVVEHDPLSPYAASMHAYVLGLANEYDEALAQAQRAVELDRESFFARWILMELLWWAGKYEEAIEMGQSVFRISGRHPLALATSIIAHVKAGKREIAEALWAELQARARTEWVQSFWLAAVEGMIGDRDRAMALAFRAVEERDPFAIAAKTWPHWEALRSHPEFPTLLEKLGLA